MQLFSSRQAHGPSPALDLPRLAIAANAFAACVGIDSCSRRRPSYGRRADQMGGKRVAEQSATNRAADSAGFIHAASASAQCKYQPSAQCSDFPLIRQIAAHGATPQCCPIFGRGVPKTAIAPTTSSQNGTTPTPGIASRTSPGKSSHCQPSTTNNSAAVTTSTAHPIGGAKLAKAPMTSDTPATMKASASRNTENLRSVEAVSVDGFSKSEGAEGSDILTVTLRLVGSGADTTFGTAELECQSARRNSRHFWPVRRMSAYPLTAAE